MIIVNFVTSIERPLYNISEERAPVPEISQTRAWKVLQKYHAPLVKIYKFIRLHVCVYIYIIYVNICTCLYTCGGRSQCDNAQP